MLRKDRKGPKLSPPAAGNALCKQEVKPKAELQIVRLSVGSSKRREERMRRKEYLKK